MHSNIVSLPEFGNRVRLEKTVDYWSSVVSCKAFEVVEAPRKGFQKDDENQYFNSVVKKEVGSGIRKGVCAHKETNGKKGNQARTKQSSYSLVILIRER